MANKKVELIFEGLGKCEVCLITRQVHFMFYRPTEKWMDLCNGCESKIAPYLKPTVEKPIEKFGGYRI